VDYLRASGYHEGCDRSDVLREVILIAATMTMGLMAGVFGLYSNSIMPGLRRPDDRTFVAAFQAIDRRLRLAVSC
jgi:uncharacterized membrane protein